VQWTIAAIDTVEPSMADLFVLDKFHADKAWAKERRPAFVATAQKRLASLDPELAGRSYLLGDELGVQDIVMSAALRLIQHTGLLDAAPNVAAYKARCEARPAWRKIYEAYEQRLAA
jgi:glutathione S-transferase